MILRLASHDSLSLKFYAIRILQDMVAFHLKDPNPEALIDADLKRLKFVKEKSVIETKDSLFLTALQTLEKKFINNPASSEISYEIANHYVNLGSKYNPLEGEKLKWHKKTAFEKCNEAIKRFPESFGALNCKYLQGQIGKKLLQVTTEKVNVPMKPFRAFLEYGNLNKIFIRIVKIDQEKYNRNTGKMYGEELLKSLIELPAVKEWQVDLPDDSDYQQHSVEIKIPDLPLGHYIILASANKEFTIKDNGIAYGNTWISNISYIQRGAEEDGYEFTVLDRERGYPLSGVKAQLLYEKYNYITRDYEYKKGAAYTTDENGYFTVPPPSEYRNFMVEFTYGDDKLNTRDMFYQYRRYPPEMRTYLRTFFFTDRAIYRPGQTVYYKGIVIETNGENNKIKTKESVTVTLYDVNYQKVSSLNLITNDYGTIQGTFSLPIGLLNGQFQLSDGHGYYYFSVEDYKRPRFEVKFNPVKGAFKLNTDVAVSGKAQSYSGANLDGAEVKYRVVRNATFPWRCYWWRGYYPTSPEMEITNGFTSTNDTGGYFITFRAIPDLSISASWKPVYTYTVYADVTDITGETHSSESYVSVGYAAMKIDVAVPAEVCRDSIAKFRVSSANLAGEYEPSKGKIEVWKLKEPAKIFRKRLWKNPDRFVMTKEEYYSNFPSDVYADEDNIYKWEKGEKTAEVAFDTEKNKELFLKDISGWKTGLYVMEAVTKDRFGEEVKDTKYFTLFTAKNGVVPYPVSAWFTAVKSTGEPGGKAGFVIGSGLNDVKVLFEVEHKNKIVRKEWFTLNNNQKFNEILIEETHRGNFGYHLVFVMDNRAYAYSQTITVPFTNKQLDIEFETFRNKLIPGQKEEWKVKIRDKKGEKVASEMVAAMYDASLDAFRPNAWYFNIYDTYYNRLVWQWNRSFLDANFYFFTKDWNNLPPYQVRHYDMLNWFGYYFHDYYGYRHHSRREYLADEAMAYDMALEEPTPAAGAVSEQAETTAKSKNGNTGGDVAGDKGVKKEGSADFLATATPGKSGETAGGKRGADLSGIPARVNLNETAFFYPQLETDAEGSVIIKFTMPEALTRWKFLGFAHTKELQYGQIEKEVITQKELMVTPHAPRFFREGDKIKFTAKVSNLSDKDLSGNAQISFFDAISMKDVTSAVSYGDPRGVFTAKKGSSALLSFDLAIPEGFSALAYRVVAKADNFSDGEEAVVPVLTNRMMVTESLPLPVRSKQTKNFKFEKFISQNNGSETLRNHKFTLEFSSNPAWYAVQALPYIMEYPYECAEQVFSRYYANSIAAHIANSSPKIKAVFDSWKNSPSLSGEGKGEGALLSNLEKNQELKSLLLEETPWVLDAKDESERKKRVALLFDLNRMSGELENALRKLQKMQLPNGGWPWFESMEDDRYITQHIITGMGHLRHLGVIKEDDSKTSKIIRDGVEYLDQRIREDYEWILKHDKENLNKNHIGYVQIQYLYARSYFREVAVAGNCKDGFEYFRGQAKKYWLSNNRYMQGMIALALHRYEDKITPMEIIRSLKENALVSEEMGMYWKDDYEGYYWWESPIENHALLVEAFDEVVNDKKAVDDLRVWLLKSKQTQNWKTTKATTEAVYALLLRGTDWLATESDVEISLGGVVIDPKKMEDVKVEAGTGYFKTSWSGRNISPDMGNIRVSKAGEGVSWGAVYWQYFEQLDKITPHKTPLSIVKKLFIERNTPSGPVIEPIDGKTTLKPGDKLKVRIELRVDRDMEYVHMKDMRASGFEPVNVFSSYQYQDGLAYYESTRDAATNFFFPHLPKGTYVFEYPLLVSHSGDFSNGITTIQCMYAPEFASHSEGVRVKVGK